MDPAPWEQQPGETSKSFAAFRVFRDMGPDRSLNGAYRAFHKGDGRASRAPRPWREWHKAFDWKSRALKWDARADLVEQVAREKVIAAQAAAEQRRKQKQRDWEEEFLALGRERLSQILRLPLIRRTVNHENGRDVIVYEPVKVAFRDAIELAKAIMTIGRLNAKMPAAVTDDERPDGFEPDERFL